MLFLALFLPSLLAALLAFFVVPYQPWVGRVNALLSLPAMGAATVFAGHAIAGLDAPTFGRGELLRGDGLSALLMVCITFVSALALFFAPGLWSAGHYDATQTRRYHIYTNLFIAAMLVAVSANNVALMWIAIEATTIFSALVIPLTISKASVEASWKYILICSVGIALAFTGTVLAYFGFVTRVGHATNALNWTVLLAAAPSLQAEVMRLAFIFLLIGYGTKAGIAPMHTWLPDAHSEAPATLSAMMSGVLLAVALYAVIRWKVVVDAAIGAGFTNRLLIALGVASLAIAALSVVLQRNYKRMLAYSSIEHTGLMCVGLALGPLGAFATFLHLINHTAAKSLMFILAGRLADRYQTTEISSVSGFLKVMPWTAALFTIGMMATLGLPPFGMFVSEFALIRAGFAADQPWLMATLLVLLAVAFVSFIGHLNRMLYGAPPSEVRVGEQWSWHIAPLFLNVGILLVLGLALPGPLNALIDETVKIVSKP